MPAPEPTAAVSDPAAISALDILRAARDAIAAPDRWAQGNEAFAADGEEVEAESPEAVRRCMVGALWYGRVSCRAAAGLPWLAAHQDQALTLADALLDSACRRRAGCGIEDYNDTPGRTHSEALAAFNEAIADAVPHTASASHTAGGVPTPPATPGGCYASR